MLILFPFSVYANSDELAQQAELIKAQKEIIEELQNRVERLEKALGITSPKQKPSESLPPAEPMPEAPIQAATKEAPEPKPAGNGFDQLLLYLERSISDQEYFSCAVPALPQRHRS